MTENTTKKREKIRIISDGTTEGTYMMMTESGTYISDVVGITWSARSHDKHATAVLEIRPDTVELEVELVLPS